MRRLVKAAQAEYVLNNPRKPRRRPIANQRVRALHGEGQVEDEDAYDIDTKSKLLTEFYENLFEATEEQSILPQWVDLTKQFHSHELAGLPTIDGSLLRNAINLFANNKGCAADAIVSEMLSVLDEDVLETLAEAFINRILNTESEFIWKKPRRATPTSSGINMTRALTDSTITSQRGRGSWPKTRMMTNVGGWGTACGKSGAEETRTQEATRGWTTRPTLIRNGTGQCLGEASTRTARVTLPQPSTSRGNR